MFPTFALAIMPSVATVVEIDVRQNLCVLGKAGFSDRTFLYCTLAGILARHNKTLFVPTRACDAFERNHNFLVAVPCEKPWDAYMKLSNNIRPMSPGHDCRKITNGEAYGTIAKSPHHSCNLPLTCTEHVNISLPRQFVSVHVRRGDILYMNTKRFHNDVLTSIVSVVNHYTAHMAQANHTAIIVRTNERDPAYLKLLERELKLHSKKEVIMIEKLLEKVCDTNNNYCVYCNGMQLSRQAVLHHNFGRHGGK
jgi:hypothetical protein